MPIRVLVEDEGEWEFPDDATDEEIVAAINREQGLGPRGIPPLPPGFILDEPAGQVPPPPPGFVLDEERPRPRPAPLVASHPVGSPAGGAALPQPPRSPLLEALVARKAAAGGAPLMPPAPLVRGNAPLMPPAPLAPAHETPAPAAPPSDLGAVGQFIEGAGASTARALPGLVAGALRSVPTVVGDTRDALIRGYLDLLSPSTEGLPQERVAELEAKKAEAAKILKWALAPTPSGPQIDVLPKLVKKLEDKFVRPHVERVSQSPALSRIDQKWNEVEKGQRSLGSLVKDPEMIGAAVGEGGASLVPMVAAPNKTAGYLLGMIMEAGGALSDVEEHERRTGQKLSPAKRAATVALTGAISGALERLGFENAVDGIAVKMLPPKFRKGFVGAAMRLLTGSAGELGVESGQQASANGIAKLLYDPTRPWSKDVIRAGATGALTGGAVGGISGAAQYADTRARGGRIADIRRRREAEANWRSEDRPWNLDDEDGGAPVPAERAAAATRWQEKNIAVRGLKNPETADEGLRRLKLQTEALDARLQGLREPGATRAPEAAAFDPEGRRVVPPATVDAINEGVRDLLRPETANERTARPPEATAAPVRRSELPSGGAESPLGAGPGAVTKTPRLEAESGSPEGEDGGAQRTRPHSLYARGREENDPLESPEEADRSFLEGLGLSPEQAREVGARMPTSDEVTGYATARHHGPALERAQAWAERTGRPAQYVEIDVHNLGGMNAALGHSGADRVLRGITESVRAQFPEEPGRRVSFIRHGGDELSLVAAGYTEDEVGQRMERAEAAVAEVVRAAGLSDIPHAKGATDEAGRERRRGAGIFWGAAPIEPGSPLSRTREVADFAVEARKFTRRAEDVDRKQAVPSRNPAGPRPGGDATADLGGRTGGPGSAPEVAPGERTEEVLEADRKALAGAESGRLNHTDPDTPTRARGGFPAAADRAAEENERGARLGVGWTPKDTLYARGREAFRNRFGEDAPGLDRFLTLAEMVRQEAPDASHEEAHEAALVLLEEERRFAPRGAEVDTRAGAPHSRDARGVGALAEGTSRTPGAPREVLASRAVARSISRDPNPRARGIPVRELAAAVARAEETWPAAPGIAVVRDESELPLEVQEVLGGAKVRGIYHGGRHGDPSSGTVFLLADRVSSVAEAFETLVHELVGHAGVMAVLGPRAWKETVRGVLESREGRRLVAEWMDGHGEPYAFDLATEGGREGAVAETLAWIAERRLASPTYSPPTFYRRVLAKVRLWLRGIGRRFGVTPDALAWNEEDIDALLASAARRFEGGERVEGSGTWLSRAPENGGADGNPTLSDAQRRRVAELVSRTRERLAETDPRWRTLGEDLAGEGRQRQDSPALEDGDQTNPDTPSRVEARPDLANPGLEEEGRRLVERVDSARTEAGEPARRADAEVNAAADRRLEADWEGERRALLARGRQGAGLDDVETVAAKKIISAEAFAAMKALDVETLAETAELIDAYRRTGTAQAQAFRQRRDEVRNPRERMAAFVAEAVLRPGEETSEKVRTGTPAQRREALKRHGEQAKAVLEKLRDRGIDVANLSDEDLADRFLVARVVREVAAARADLSDKVFEYWSNAILSGPLTHIANVTGNTVSLAVEYGIQQPLEMVLGSVAGGGRSLAEGRALYGSVFRGVVRGARNAAEAFRTEQRALGEAGDPLAPDRLEARVAIGGRTGRAVRIPYRFLRAADEFYRGLIGEMEAAATAHGIARREGLSGEALEERMTALLEDGESAAWQSASDRADLLTFQEELGRFGRIVLEARRKIPGLRYILPFVTTPANIFKTALRKSPAGAVRSLYLLSRRELSRDEAIRAGAEQLIGLGVVTLLAQGIGGGPDEEEPWITGTVPFRGSRKGERDLSERTAPPLSVRIGGKWYGYGRLEPLATWLGITVDGLRGVKEAREGKEPDAVIGDAVKRFAGQLEDKTFLDGIGRIIRAIDDGRSALRVVGDVAGGFVPALLRQPAQALEEKVRESRAWGAGPSPKHEGERYESRLARRIAERAAPFALEGTARVNAYGEDVEKPNRTFLGRLFSPVQRFDPETLPADVRRIDAAFRKWNELNPDAAFYPPIPDPRWTRGGRTYFLSDEEYRTLLRRTGLTARRDLRKLLDDAGGMFGEEEIRKARKAFQRAAREARKSLKGPRASGVGDEEGAR